MYFLIHNTISHTSDRIQTTTTSETTCTTSSSTLPLISAFTIPSPPITVGTASSYFRNTNKIKHPRIFVQSSFSSQNLPLFSTQDDDDVIRNNKSRSSAAAAYSNRQKNNSVTVKRYKNGDNRNQFSNNTKKSSKPTYYNNNYANNNPQNEELERAKAINKEVITSSTAQDVLDLFISKGGARGVAGGGVFNSVNYSTILHRLARFSTQMDHNNNNNNNNPRNNNNNNNDGPIKNLPLEAKRRMILSDPRFAILLASLGEALVQPNSNKILIFNNRELANVGWAIAKLRVVPPANVSPITRPEYLRDECTDSNVTNNDNDDANIGTKSTKKARVIYSSREQMQSDLLELCTTVRLQVLEVAKERNQIIDPNLKSKVPNRWIPNLSQLAGKLLDMIAYYVLELLHEFNSQELANLLYAFSSAGRADEVLFGRLVNQLIDSMEQQVSVDTPDKVPKPQEFSNSIWAFASSGLRGSGQIRLVQYIADIMDENNGEIVSLYKPQELSNTAWGIATLISKRSNLSNNSNGSTSDLDNETQVEDDAALRTLRWVAKSLQERADDFKPQELSNSIWAFATVGFGASTPSDKYVNTNNDNICLPSDQPDLDRKLVERASEVVAKSAVKRLYRFRPQELNNLAWGLCRLGFSDGSFRQLFEGIGQEIIKRHHQFAPQDIGTTLWSFATVEYFDEKVYKTAASELSLRDCQSFKPQELSNTVWALATAGASPKHLQAFDTSLIPTSKRITLSEITDDPFTECFAAATTELIRRPHDFKEQEIKDILWSLSKAGIRHPMAFRKVAEHLVGSDEDFANGKTGRGLDGFSPQGLGNLAWSYAKQAQLADAVSESNIGTTGRLAVFETSCLDIGESLINRLFRRIAERGISNETGLSRYKPQDLSNTCWAFATLGMLHREFFDAVAEQVHSRLSHQIAPKSTGDSVNVLMRFKAQEIANLVWSFATLNYNAEGIMDCFAPYIVSMCSNKDGSYDVSTIAKYIKRQETANIAWSCAVLKQYPEPLMPLLYTALFGDGEPQSIDSLKSIYSDDGLQRQAIMTMFYVQLSLDMEAPELDLALPTHFPVGWWESDTKRPKAVDDERDTSSSMLELTTSRLQTDVSQALNRVGFSHIQEHVIATDDLRDSHEINLSEERLEFLSIDIANIQDRVGIEVDGPAHFINILDEKTNNDKMGIQAADNINNSKGKSTTKSMNDVTRKGKNKKGLQPKYNFRTQVNGPTALKHRLLCHLGWCIAHIPHWEWRHVAGDNEGEENFCREILEEII
jgi:hypothetical protein